MKQQKWQDVGLICEYFALHNPHKKKHSITRHSKMVGYGVFIGKDRYCTSTACQVISCPLNKNEEKKEPYGKNCISPVESEKVNIK